jgi:hypothetical protein
MLAAPAGAWYLSEWASPGAETLKGVWESDAAVRRSARAVVETYERKFGHLPLDRWPKNYADNYRQAKRILGEPGD